MTRMQLEMECANVCFYVVEEYHGEKRIAVAYDIEQ